MKDRTCISCGMPIRSAKDSPAGHPDKPYCTHCSNRDGTMKSYDDVLSGMTEFIIRGQGLDETVARKMATEMMARQPAWSGRLSNPD